MLTVYIYKGLPASGKSTDTKKKLSESPNKYKRINKDDLRAMLDDSYWSSGNEKFILTIRDMMIIEALKNGKHVLIDDTNLNPMHEKHIAEIIKPFDAQIEIIDFTHVPVEECIRRDQLRDGKSHVGKKVIMDMYNKYLKPKPVKLQQNAYLSAAAIFDIDGTLALTNGRNPYDMQRVDEDKANYPIVELLQILHSKDYKIIIVSGRDDSAKTLTEEWLKNNHIEYNLLLMRTAGDKRNDAIVKQELFDKFIRGMYYVKYVFDDRNQVIDLWRNKIGLTTLQVANGDF